MNVFKIIKELTIIFRTWIILIIIFYISILNFNIYYQLDNIIAFNQIKKYISYMQNWE